MTLALLGGPRVRTAPFTTWPIFGEAEEARLLRTLRSGNWGRLDGQEVAEFEQRFAAMHGCRHGIGVVNGTVSLRIALMAAGIRAEDEVIVPPYTFISTASAVIEANAIPVFADIDLNTFNLDPAAVEAAITSRTRAIIPVHFAGQPADMAAIMAIAEAHGLTVIEDAAHAHGASYRGRPAGSLGHLASFSFQSSKNLTAGEGGIIITNDDALAESCRSIQNCGRVPVVCGTSTTSFPATIAWENFREPSSTVSWNASRSRPARATPMAAISRPDSLRSRASSRSRARPIARGTAITCSC